MNVRFTEEQRKSLEDFALELNTTIGGVLKTALSLLSVAVCEIKNGNCVGIVKNGRVIKEIEGILVDKAAL